MRFSFFTTVAMAAISATSIEAIDFDVEPDSFSQVDFIDEQWNVEGDQFAQAIAEIGAFQEAELAKQAEELA